MATSISGAIIAAGKGERLRPATNHLPKPLVKINGEPLLQRQIRTMLQTGIDPIHVVVNEETAALLKEHRVVLPREVELAVANTASSMESLFLLGDQIASQDFVLAMVDSIVDADEFQQFLNYGRRVTSQQAYDGVIGTVRWRGDERPLFVSVEEGSIIRFGSQKDELVTAGFYFLSSQIFRLAGEARHLRLGALRQFLSLLIERGLRLGAFRFELAIDIDEDADLRAARAIFAGEQGSSRTE
jgi:NDP-sugar pyrophosphorylase family protein